jgi:hypothetical protein
MYYSSAFCMVAMLERGLFRYFIAFESWNKINRRKLRQIPAAVK